MIDEIDPILKLIPKDQLDRVFNQHECDIEPCFMGFTKIYKNLSNIIPQHFSVIDLGCAYNPQCFYFKEHKEFISVDISDCEKFETNNCRIFNMSIEEFICKHLIEFDLDETFAICSFVPGWGGDNIKLVRESFKNVFTFYPSDKKGKSNI